MSTTLSVTPGEPVWYRKYAPKTIEELCLPETIKAQLRPYSNPSEPLPAMIFNGPPGVGKTSAAHCLGYERGATVLFINASMKNSIDVLRNEIADFVMQRGLSLDGDGENASSKIVILDEAERLTPATQDALKGFTEEFSSLCSFIFTCNNKARLIPALHSRATVVDFTFTKEDSKQIGIQLMRRCGAILKAEGVEYEAVAIKGLVEKQYPNARKIVGTIQHAAKTGKVGVGVLAASYDELDIAPLLELMRARKLSTAYVWVKQNLEHDINSIYRKFFDARDTFAAPEYIPEMVIFIHDYMKELDAVADPEISACAFIAHISGTIVWKS